MVSEPAGGSTVRSHTPYSAGLRRDMDVLRELASEESLRRSGLGVVRIAERLGREKSQVSRALRALQAEGLVDRDPRTRTFQLGWGLYRLAARGVETRLVSAASAHLHRLAGSTQGRARLCVLIGGQVLSLITATSAATAPFDPRSDGRAVPLMSTPAGPTLLLDWPDSAIADLRAHTLPAAAEPDRLAGFLRQAREQGCVVFGAGGTAPGDTVTDDGVAGQQPLVVAAPVRDFRGIVLAAIELRCDPDADGARACESTVAAADRLSADLGYEPR